MDAKIKRGEQSRSEERKITIGNKSRRAGTGGRCMDFLRAILYCTIRAQEGGAKVQGEEKEEWTQVGAVVVARIYTQG